MTDRYIGQDPVGVLPLEKTSQAGTLRVCVPFAAIADPVVRWTGHYLLPPAGIELRGVMGNASRRPHPDRAAWAYWPSPDYLPEGPDAWALMMGAGPFVGTDHGWIANRSRLLAIIVSPGADIDGEEVGAKYFVPVFYSKGIREVLESAGVALLK